MALNFPDSPVLNQVFSALGKRWKWDGTTWISLYDKGNVKISDTPPPDAVVGDLWFDSSTGVCFVYYYDGDTYQWTDIGTGGNTLLPSISSINSPSIDLDWNASTKTLSAATNGFLFVPLNDPLNPTNTNSNADGTNVISWSANGNTTATPYSGAVQTANLTSIVPNNAYMVLVKFRSISNMFSNTSAFIYVRKNSSGLWSRALEEEGIGSSFETTGWITLPIIFDRGTKSFQAYFYDPKDGGAPTQAPAYDMFINVLGYYIK